jgi:hypothetical protein
VGNLLDAQIMVLGAIETQVGGTAAAGVTASDKMKQGFNQIKETLGLALLPTFNKVGDYISTKFIPYIKDFIDRFKEGKTALNPVFDAIKGFVGFMITYKDFLLPIVAGIVAVVAAFKIYQGIMAIVTAVTTVATGVQAAFNFVLTANPIGIIVVAIGVLIAALVLFFTKTTIGKAIFKSFVDGVKLGFEFIKGLAIDFANVFVDGLNLIIHGINLFIRAWNMIPGHIDIKTVNTIGNIEGGLTSTNNPLTPQLVTPTATTGVKQAQHRGTGNTLIYNAAPNQSIDSHKDLIKAIDINRTKGFK